MNTRVLLLLLFILGAGTGMYFWFGRRAPVPKPPSVTKTQPAPAPVIAPPQEAGSSAAEPRHYRPKPVTADVRRKVDDFIRRYKDVSPEELNKSGELASFMERLERMTNSPEFLSEMGKRIEAIEAARGQKHGMLTIGSGKLDDPENRAFLEAMFSDDADLLQEYLLNKLDGAIFEFAFDPTLENAGNGVTVKSDPSPAPAASKLPD